MSQTHTQIEIEESLLPEIVDRNNTDEARRKRIFIIIFLSFFFVMIAVVTTGIVYFVSTAKKPPPLERPTVIMVSLDGFRWDYLDLYPDKATNLNRLRSEGTYSKIHPMFTTKTFPNHYSIVTGLYPESHGIISNTFFDPVFNATFTISDSSATSDARWWGGEPVWVTAQKNGLKSGVFFWPGSEAPIEGILPTYFKKFNGSVPMDTRVNGVIEWLNLPASDRPNLLGLYMEPVDTAGHEHGPISDGVGDAIAEVDEALGRLLDYLDTSGKFNTTNLVIVSDHGMTLLDTSRVVFLDDCIDLSKVTVVDWSPNGFILPKNPDDTQEIFEQLQTCSETYPNITAYLREDIPAPLFFNSSRRITPILVIADMGWSITSRAAYNPAVYNYTNKGNHGYDNRGMDMQGIFLAHGPNVKRGHTVDQIPNVDVYNFISAILQISPAPNNGTSFLVDNVAILDLDSL